MSETECRYRSKIAFCDWLISEAENGYRLTKDDLAMQWFTKDELIASAMRERQRYSELLIWHMQTV